MLRIAVTKSELKNQILETYKHKIGTLYFFENVVVSEINHGEHVDMKSATQLVNAINEYYNNSVSFGYISNRINDFSISPLDFSNFNSFLGNIKCYSAVTYSSLNSMNSELERRFCKLPYQEFKCLTEAFHWTKASIRAKKTS